jgi:hypothetical protein
MTLEERIEEIELYAYEYSPYAPDIFNMLQPIIQELQNKNKDLKAKLKELNNG